MKSSFDSPARLKSIDLSGYKTFASKTEFVFAPTITAIVGPNGVGKSNIADAIRWVLGEQSYRLLRAKKTEDIIFTGSDTRSRAGMASATIVFDNSEGWLPIEFSEVSIGRRAYRDGNNEYLLNGQRVRLRDVVELLSECGLAERTYTIIGQGLVDTALSLRAEERRRLFEEAAGIGLYRIRRQEAERRLEASERNLERAQDILAELRPRLRSLERQARRASDYDQVRADLQEALRIWYGHHWHSMQSEVLKRRTEARNQEAKRDDLRLRHEAIDRDLSDARRGIDTLRSELHGLSQEVSRLYGQRESRGRRLAVAQERKRWLADQETFLTSELSSLDDRRKLLQERIQRAQSEVDRRRDALAAAEYSLEQPATDGEGGGQDRARLSGRLRELQASHEQLLAERAAWDARLAQLNEGAKALTDRQNALRKDITTARSAVKEAEELSKACEADLAKTTADLAQAERRQEAARKRVSELEAALSAAESDASDLRSRRDATTARLEALHHSQRSSDRIASSLKELSEKGDLSGLAGRFSEAMQVAEEHKRAIAAALGAFSEGMAFEMADDVMRALDRLASMDGEDQVALLPLAPLQDLPPLEAPEEDGCLGNAAELVQVPRPYRALANLLLGRTLIVDDRAAARRCIADLPSDGRVVTLSGEVFYPSGAVLVGSDLAAGLARIAELEADMPEQQAETAAAEDRARDLAAELDAARKASAEAQTGVENARRAEADAQLALKKAALSKEETERREAFATGQAENLEGEIARTEETRREVETSGANFDLEREALEAELDIVQSQLLPEDGAVQEFGSPLQMAARAEQSARGKLSEISHEIKLLEREEQDWQRRLSANQAEQADLQGEIAQAEQDVAGVEQRLEEITKKSEPAEQALSDTEDQRAKLEADESLTRSLLQDAERAHSQLQIDLARREEELASLRRRIEDDFGLVTFEEDAAMPGQEPLPLQGLVERLPRVEEIPFDLQPQIGRLRAQLRRMGAINPEAQREYEEVRQRVDFLDQQLADSRKAASQIRDVITELDMLMEREFRATFEAVAREFREAFGRLFGGGSARLVLTDAEDFNSVGIDIEAKLPGRREQGLAVLSGGERSLTAAALIFALLKVSPTPFCVLDEVDAMLDETNVLRFIEMLRELSQETQFILITHNRQTVQAAEVIYGISMGSDSASRAISLRLDEAIKQVAV